MSSELILFIALLVLIVSSGFFSSSEVALFSLSPMKVKAFKQDQEPKKKLIGTLLSKPRDLLVTVFIMNTLVNILLQNVASDMFGRFANWGLKVGVPLALTLIFGEIIPKNFGLQYNERLSLHVIKSINFFQKLLSPIRAFVIYVTTPVSRLLFFYLKKADPISKEELKHTLETSKTFGVLNNAESEFATGYIKLQDATVKEVMRPKGDILFFNITEPLSKLIYLFMDQQCTRIPVCREGLDSVIGVITAPEFFKYSEQIPDSDTLVHYLNKPFFVPENVPAKVLFKRLTEQQEHFSLVVDEYGSVSGLITMEDICELVVGEIQDLRDKKLPYTRSGKQEIIAGGRLELSEFNQIFNSDLPNPNNMVTIGGWLIEKLGEIPKSGTKYETNDFLFHILAADPNRLRRIYVRKKGE